MSAPSLLTLPPELVHQTLLHLLPPHSTPRQSRRLLSPLLSIHPTLTPVVRKLLYNKVGFVVGDPERNEVKLLGLLEREHREETKGGGTGQGSGIWVRVMKIRCPEPGPGERLAGDGGEEEEEDPAAALLPRPRVSQVATLERVTRLVKATKGVRHVEWDLRCGTMFEGSNSVEEGEFGEGAQEKLQDLKAALKGWKAIDTFIFAVEDPQQRLQLFSSVSSKPDGLDFISPLLSALQSWSNLTALDLWRVSVALPSTLPPPTFNSPVN